VGLELAGLRRTSASVGNPLSGVQRSSCDDDFEGTAVDMECSSKPRECWLDSARQEGIWALSPVPSPVEPKAECFQTAIKEGKKTLLQSTLLHVEESSPPSLTSPVSTDVGRCVL